MASVEIRLLGGFEATLKGGARITLPIRKAELLLAYLALSPGTPKPREKLMALLWSGRDDSQARGSLRHALTALRKGLGEAEAPLVVADRVNVDLDPAALEVDVLRFEALAGTQEADALDEAAALYKGDLLDGIPARDPEFNDWLAAERARLRDLALGVFARLLDHQAAQAAPDRAVATARRLLELDPLREASHRALMALLAASGERAAALQQFETCRALLAKELGVSPDPETEALCETIRAGDAAPPPAAAPVPAPEPSPVPASAETAVPAEALSVAVLPFRNLMGDAAEETYVDGFTKEVMNRLSRFRHLEVAPSRSAFAFKNDSRGVPEIAAELDVRFIVEGAVRKEGELLRVDIEFVDARENRQLWSETYDHAAADPFIARDSIAALIVGSLGIFDGGLITRAAFGDSRRKAEDVRTADDTYVLATEHQMRFTEKDLEIADVLLDKALVKYPDHVPLLVCRGWNEVIGWHCGWREDRTAAKERALALADEAARIVSTDPDIAWLRGGIASLIDGDFEAGEPYYRKALAQNPSSGEIRVFWGAALALGGRAEEGMTEAREAIAMVPNHPPWYLWSLGIAAYIARQYDEAIEALEGALVGGREGPNARYYLAAAYAQAGHAEKAQALAGELRAQRPDWSAERVAAHEPFAREDDRAHLLDGLRKAGLGEAADPGPASPATDAAGSTAPSVIVLPFANLSGDPEQDYFVDGMTEDITTELARFRTLTVIASQSAMTYKGRAVDPRDVAEETGVAYVVQGSVRRAGERIRIAAQLVDSLSGEQLWNERYDRELEDVFAVQDEVAQTVVSTLAGHLRLAEEKRAKRKHPASLQAYDYVLQAGEPLTSRDGAAAAAARAMFEEALALDPEYVEALVGIALTHLVDHEYSWTPPEARSLEKGFDMAQRAVALDPNHAVAQSVLGYAYSHRRDYARSQVHYERAIPLNPSDINVLGGIGYLLVLRGRVDEGIEACNRARRINPLVPDWYAWLYAMAHYVARRYGEALAAFDQVAEWHAEMFAFAAACHAQLGDDAEARRLMAEFHSGVKHVVAVYPGADRKAWRRYHAASYPFEHDEDFVHLMEGFEKAGLYELA